MAINRDVKLNDDGTVTITAEYLQEMQDDEFMLRCLESGGVDNWVWYGESLTEYHEMLEAREEAAG